MDKRIAIINGNPVVYKEDLQNLVANGVVTYKFLNGKQNPVIVKKNKFGVAVTHLVQIYEENK